MSARNRPLPVRKRRSSTRRTDWPMPNCAMPLPSSFWKAGDDRSAALRRPTANSRRTAPRGGRVLYATPLRSSHESFQTNRASPKIATAKPSIGRFLQAGEEFKVRIIAIRGGFGRPGFSRRRPGRAPSARPIDRNCRPMPNPIPVVFCFDKSYVDYSAVAMFSLLTNSNSPVKIHCIVSQSLDGGLGTIRRIAGEFGSEVQENVVDDEAFDNWREIGHIKRASYYRLLIPDLV